MPIKVSVVLLSRDPGAKLEKSIGSLLKQTLPHAHFEVILVDCGSTDGTSERLDQLAAEQANFHLLKQANHEGPGHPRNFAASLARGDYITFLEAGDWLGAEALERLYEYGTQHGSDIVAGKIASKGRAVPRVLFSKDRPFATLENAPLIDSLGCHKLFRRQFLMEHQIRFTENRIGLVDHAFVARAYLLAHHTSVLSSYVCFYQTSGSQWGSPVLEDYFKGLREALDVVESHTQPGALRDKIYRRWLRVEMTERMRGQQLLKQDPENRDALLKAMRELIINRFGQGVLAGLQPAQQVITALILGELSADLVAFAQWESSIHVVSEIDRVRWHGGSVELSVRAELMVGPQPMAFFHIGGVDVLEPPLSPEARGIVGRVGANMEIQTHKSALEAVLRERASAAESSLPVKLRRSRLPVAMRADFESGAYGERFRLIFEGEISIASQISAGEKGLSAGSWDPVVRIRLGGWNKSSVMGRSSLS
ncbi:glycosyltransferase family 2 protein [Streptomyces sp. x-80]|uniref:glycosyltransferase family 2 protein n=1 Tax=Streptomyces sp. x-80 TaxID=2789282 RepID=UPI00397F7E18